MSANGKKKESAAPKMRIAKISDFALDPENANKHTEYGEACLEKSLRNRGFFRPVAAVGDNTIMAGNSTIEQAASIGMEDAIVIETDGTRPIIHKRVDIKSHKSKTARRLAIEDNRIAEISLNWDDKIITDLAKLDYDFLSDLWTDAELADFGIDVLPEANDDEHAGELVDKAEELQKHWQVKIGDLWECGEHRIICGDCTHVDVVERLLSNDKPKMMVTDPPYGVEYNANWRNEVYRANGKPYGAIAVGLVKNDQKYDWREAWSLFEGDVAYVWHAGRHAKQVQESLEICDFIIRNQIIWAKPRFVISRGDYHWQHEPCWYAVRKGAKGNWCGDRSQTTLWEISHNVSETGHSTQKPIECMARPIRNNSEIGDMIYDPFVGSGTTMIACESLKRKCRACEINPAYVAVTLQRWSDLTGKTPKLIQSV